MTDGAPVNATRRYQPLFEIARGGIGSVHLAVKREGEFERLYAMKTLHPHYVTEESIRSMFLAEAKIAGLIRHPNVVAVSDVGETRDGPFLVMDYVEGVSLGELMRAPELGHLSVALSAKIASDVARGLHAAHELEGHDGSRLRVVHRDVSPQNILLGFDGVVRVTDFGIAKALGQQDQTATGILKGKLGYMAPEQLRFQRPDHRTDLYALGVVLFEMLSGRRLYSGGMESDVPQRILFGPVPDIEDFRRDVPPALQELLMQLLAKLPDHRPDDALEVADRLQLVAEEGSDLVAALQACLETHFGERRREVRARVARALRDGIPDPTYDATAEPDPGASRSPVAPASIAAPAGPPRGRSRWSVVAIVASAIAATAVAVAVLRTPPDDAPDAPPPTSATPASVDLAPTEVPVETQVDVAPADDAADEPPPLQAAPAEPEDEEAAEPEPARPARGRSRRRRPPSARPTRPAGDGERPEGWWGWN